MESEGEEGHASRGQNFTATMSELEECVRVAGGEEVEEGEDAEAGASAGEEPLDCK